MYRKVFLPVLVAVLVSASASAQQADDCSAVLAESLKTTLDTRSTGSLGNSSSLDKRDASSSRNTDSGSRYLSRELTDAMCSKRGAAESHGNGGSLNVGVPIQGVPVQFGGDMKSSDASQWFDDYCGNSSDALHNSGSTSSLNAKSKSSSDAESGNYTNAQSEALALQFLPAANVEAWKACMLAKISSQKAQHITMTSSQNASTITLQLDWHPDALRSDAPVVTEFWADGATCSNPPLPNKPIEASRLILCKANPNSAVTIVLNTNQGSAGPIQIAAPPPVVDGGSTAGPKKGEIPKDFRCVGGDEMKFAKVGDALTITYSSVPLSGFGMNPPKQTHTLSAAKSKTTTALVNLNDGPKNQVVSGTVFADENKIFNIFVPDRLEQTPNGQTPKANNYVYVGSQSDSNSDSWKGGCPVAVP